MRPIHTFQFCRALAFAAVALLALHATSGPAIARKEVPRNAQQVMFSFAPLVKRAAPAVVNVFTRKAVTRQVSPLFDDPFFRRFFGDALPRQRKRIENSLGSGVIVRPDGVIVTNYHVISGAEEIKVVLTDRREFAAKVLRADQRSDLAVLKINAGAGALPYIQLGDSDKLEVGDLVIAIGNPFGVGQTVTSGIISGLARTNVGITDFNFFIQTDAAINPGNSGGALLTMDGKLAGVNTAIFSRSGGSQGIGFAVPANMVRTVIAGAEGTGPLRRPWLGAELQDVTAEIAEAIGLSHPTGALISDIYPKGPAARAGLRVGDIVTEMDGKEIDDAEGLNYRVATGLIGKTAVLSVMRKGGPVQLRLPLEAPPEVPPRDETLLKGNQPIAGATVVNLSPAVAEDLNFSVMTKGVVITNIADGSPADRLGFRRGDIILLVNDTEVDSVATLRTAVARRHNVWHLAIRRGDQELTLTVPG